MEANQRPTLYYIRGHKTRYKEVIKALEDKGGNNYNKLQGGNESSAFFCLENGRIGSTNVDTTYYKVLEALGVELRLPEEKKALTWEDCDDVHGWAIFSQGVEGVSEIGARKSPRDIFATEQQAKSAQAAAMISQIREQGKSVYGDILGVYHICKGVTGHLQIMMFFSASRSLLQFITQEQAAEFLRHESNRKLITEYLKTF